MSQHILLSSMGAGGPRLTSYSMGSKTAIVSSGFSAMALWQLITEDRRPTEIWFLLTATAKEKAWESVQLEALKLGVEVRHVPLEDGSDVDDASMFLEKTAHAIPTGATLTLDVTQGLRHHAFLFFALALYLSEFRGNPLEGIWYSRLETQSEIKPVIDLKPVVNLAYWFSALKIFQDTGSMKALGDLIPTGEAQELFHQFSREFLTGLPVEAGITANRLAKILPSADFRLGDIPLESDLRAIITKDIESFAGSFSTKGECLLDDHEIDRQARFIRRYLESGQHNLAFGFMREWLVNRILASIDPEGWLKGASRKAVEDQLGALSVLRRKIRNKDKTVTVDPNRDAVTEEVVKLGKDWDDLLTVRNTLQHHGMRPGGVPHTEIERLESDWEDKSGWAHFPRFGGGHEALLICPVGKTPGVLFSALRHVSPARCLIVCSVSSSGHVEEAIKQAGWVGEHDVLVLHDFHSGIDEFDALRQKASPWLFESDLVCANLTGGTSLMGVLVGELVEHARRAYRRPTRRFILVDQRPHLEQIDNPWVLGEIRDLSIDKQTVGG